MSTAASFWIRSNESARTVLNAMELVGSSIPKPEDIRLVAASNFRILRVQLQIWPRPHGKSDCRRDGRIRNCFRREAFQKRPAVDAWNSSIFSDQPFPSKSFLMQSQNKATHMQKMRDDLHENL